MTYLENLLATVFSIEVGESEETIQEILTEIKFCADRRQLEGIRSELVELFAKPAVDWIHILANTTFNVAYFKTQEEAKTFVVENVWNALFSEEGQSPKHGRERLG